jgi:hypothetical protein
MEILSVSSPNPPDVMVHLIKEIAGNEMRITCWSKKIKIGSFINMGPFAPGVGGTVYEVVKIHEQRDHKGVFENPSDKENTFFDIQLIRD